MKKVKGLKSSHTSNAKKGMGDYYGSGVKAKIGVMRDSYTPLANPVSERKLKKPPKSLA